MSASAPLLAAAPDSAPGDACAAARARRPRLHLQADAMAAGEGWLPSLDGLRALSILVVMFSHLVDGRLAPGGFGVAAFFAISGFLISRLLVAEAKRAGGVDLPRFYVRRMLRLYPAMAVYVAVVVTVYALGGHAIGWGETVSTLVYGGNYFYVWLDAHGRPALMPFGIFWSLAVEEHFYLLFPPLLLLLRGRASWLFWAMVLVCAGELAWRMWNVRADPALLQGASPVYYRTDFRLDSLAFGVGLTAALETALGRRLALALGRPLPVLAASLLLLSTFAVRDPAFRETWRYSLQGLALAGLLSAVLFQRWMRPVQRVLNAPAVAWVGRLSYSLYLWHLATPEIVRTVLPASPLPAQWACRFALSFALAALSYYGLEAPLLRLRRRFGSAARAPSAVFAATARA